MAKYSVGSESKRLWYDLVDAAQSVGAIYRAATDWAKPTIDRIIDPLAGLLALNTAASITVYGLRKGAQAATEILLDPARQQVLQELIESNDIAEAALKGAAYGLPFGYANLRFAPIIMRHAFNAPKIPSWKNHLKTWAIAGTIGISAYWSGLGNQGHAMDEIEHFVSGEAAVQTVTQGRYATTQSLSRLETLMLESGYEAREDSDVRKTLSSLERARERHEDFPYTDRVSQEVERLQENGHDLTPEELTMIARTVYFEGGFDPKAEPREAMVAVASVMRNRWAFDAYQREHGREAVFSEDDHTLYDVVTRNGINDRGARVFQFTAIRDHPEYFQLHEHIPGWDIYENLKINIGVGLMNDSLAQEAYKATRDVLSGEVDDPTKGALFYQNRAASDRFNQDWGPQRGLTHTTTIGSHDFYTKLNGDNGWTQSMHLRR